MSARSIVWEVQQILLSRRNILLDSSCSSLSGFMIFEYDTTAENCWCS